MAFFADSEEVRGLRGQVAELRQQADQVPVLAGKIAMWQTADEVTQAARDALAGTDGLAIIDGEARKRAQQIAEAKEHDRLTELHTERILAAEGTNWATVYREKNESGIIRSLTERFTEDGTFVRIRQEAEVSVQTTLQEKAIAAGRAEIDAEVAAGEPAALKAAKQKWLEGYQGAKYREDVMATMQQRVDAMAPDEVRSELNDDVLGLLLAERAERLKTELEAKSTAERLTASFERGGINAQEIATHSKVSLYLGDIETVKRKEQVPRTDGYGGTVEKMVDHDVCRLNRQLTLTALGDGLFAVDGDSYHASRSALEKNSALAIGTVITIGRRIDATGKKRLEPRLQADVDFHFDLDPETPEEFDDGYGKLANVTIDGVMARPDLEVVL